MKFQHALHGISFPAEYWETISSSLIRHRRQVSHTFPPAIRNSNSRYGFVKATQMQVAMPTPIARGTVTSGTMEFRKLAVKIHLLCIWPSRLLRIQMGSKHLPLHVMTQPAAAKDALEPCKDSSECSSDSSICLRISARRSKQSSHRQHSFVQNPTPSHQCFLSSSCSMGSRRSFFLGAASTASFQTDPPIQTLAT